MLINDDNYFKVLEDIKSRIREAQYKAVLGMNKEQIILYWNIGRIIDKNIVYGNRFIDNLARDIKLEFPNAHGYSARNLRYMRSFAKLVLDESILQTVSAILTWSHNTHLIDKTNTYDEYLWYATQTIENGWSLSSLEYHTEHTTYERMPERP